MGRITNIVLLCLSVFVLSTGCAEFGKTSEKTAGIAGEELTIEEYREEINRGMVRNDVEGVLGITKNMLTDDKGRSVMIYDRISAIDVKLDSSDRDTLVLIGLAKEDDDPAIRKKYFFITVRYDLEGLVYDFDFGRSSF